VDESELRQAMVDYGASLFARGYGTGTSGNLSLRLDDDGYLMSPTNTSLGGLQARSLSRMDRDGRLVSGPPATKEAWLHLATYRARPQDRAIVHLHSTYAVALSCRTDVNPLDALPPITPYIVMRVGPVRIVPYARPGDDSIAAVVEELARSHRALLLANHGPVVAGPDLASAVSAAEELEETARLFFILEGTPHKVLTPEDVRELGRVFGLPGAPPT
jgi:ribulose-5-phosphate 4-epimerase/fuculose-1-phosphate aldolase